MDLNKLETMSSRLMRDGQFRDALKILFCMAERDNSLDGGSFGHAIGECYEALGDLHAARYWYARAYQENPAIERYRYDFEKMQRVTIDDLLR